MQEHGILLKAKAKRNKDNNTRPFTNNNNMININFCSLHCVYLYEWNSNIVLQKKGLQSNHILKYKIITK